MYLHYFYIGVLVLVALICVYANKQLASAIIDAQTRFLDALTKRFPSMGGLHWAASELSRPVITTVLYTIAVLCLVGAVWIYQLPLPPHPRGT